MISGFLTTLEEGFNVMRSNSRMLLVGVLVFVFPLLFISITQSFFSTSYDNINTSEKKRVGLLHDSLSVVVEQTNADTIILTNLVNKLRSENSDISKIRIVEKENDDFKILIATDPALVGQIEVSDSLYRNLPLSAQNQSFRIEVIIDGVRTWQTFSSVLVDQKVLYIFSEHTFGVIDSVMSARRNQSYFGLTAIFIFLIGLAYWINKQTYWQKMHANLQVNLQERDLFSNMIAHEFRTPLTAIKGYASFLEESKNISDDERRFSKNIRSSAERLVHLVSDFLEVARLQSGKLQLTLSEINLQTVFQQVTEDLKPLAEKKGLQLNYTTPKTPIFLKSDTNRIIQILTNIVTNSIKYTDTGSVTLECVEERGKVILYIKDTGTGISADDQQKLFSPFTRVGGVDSTTTTGTGLGMWITKQLVTLLKGEIGVESIKGVGTHIVISFSNEQNK